VGSGTTGTSGLVVAPSSTAASGVMPSTGTASGIVVPPTCVFVNTRHAASVPGGYDYYLRQATSPKSTYFPLHWPSVAQPLRPAPRSQSGEGEWTPEQLATGPPQQPLYRVLLLLRTDRWISCTVQIWRSAKQDYQTTCTIKRHVCPAGCYCFSSKCYQSSLHVEATSYWLSPPAVLPPPGPPPLLLTLVFFSICMHK
jgi:hypothetical protein